MLYRKPKSTVLQHLETAYLQVRAKEDRIYTDQQVQLLPVVPKNHPQYKEWLIRKNSLNKILTFLAKHSSVKRVLDLGCGNGWMSNALQQKGYEVVGIDINQLELEQAARLFPKCTFYERDIFADTTDLPKMDAVIISAALQYFENPVELINKLKNEVLSTKGFILIADTKFYTKEEVNEAQLRSEKYYSTLQSEEMSAFYFHHTFEILHQMNAQVELKFHTFEVLMNRIKGMHNPFNLYCINPF